MCCDPNGVSFDIAFKGLKVCLKVCLQRHYHDGTLDQVIVEEGEKLQSSPLLLLVKFLQNHAGDAAGFGPPVPGGVPQV